VIGQLSDLGEGRVEVPEVPETAEAHDTQGDADRCAQGDEQKHEAQADQAEN
jgi:hypothetical protein